MSEFHNRWQIIAGRAREAGRRGEAMPYGFATRVLALAREPAAPQVTIELVWQRLTFAALGVIAAILVVCAALEAPHLRDRKPLEPGIENAVAQLVWSI
jgi:hypothetical protein